MKREVKLLRDPVEGLVILDERGGRRASQVVERWRMMAELWAERVSFGRSTPEALSDAADILDAFSAETDNLAVGEEEFLRSLVEPTMHNDSEFARWVISKIHNRIAELIQERRKRAE